MVRELLVEGMDEVGGLAWPGVGGVMVKDGSDAWGILSWMNREGKKHVGFIGLESNGEKRRSCPFFFWGAQKVYQK